MTLREMWKTRSTRERETRGKNAREKKRHRMFFFFLLFVLRRAGTQHSSSSSTLHNKKKNSRSSSTSGTTPNRSSSATSSASSSWCPSTPSPASSACCFRWLPLTSTPSATATRSVYSFFFFLSLSLFSSLLSPSSTHLSLVPLSPSSIHSTTSTQAWVIYNFLALCLAYVGGAGRVEVAMAGFVLSPSLLTAPAASNPCPSTGPSSADASAARSSSCS